MAPEMLTQADPVTAYEAIAPYFRVISGARAAFLRSVERIVAFNALGAASFLDVGAGDGVRALNIARTAEIPVVVALEPSAAMRAQCPKEVLVWGCSAAEIPPTTMRFDLITFLWNVLGHLQTFEARVSALAGVRKLLSPRGAIFADFSNRYNAAHYGWRPTMRRFLYDRLFWSDTNGDLTVRWDSGGRSVQTFGHVFTQRELQTLFRASGLSIKRRWIVNYRDGATRRFPFSGHLLYQLVAKESQ
jgi:SAM-dependent methyltransferase